MAAAVAQRRSQVLGRQSGGALATVWGSIVSAGPPRPLPTAGVASGSPAQGSTPGRSDSPPCGWAGPAPLGSPAHRGPELPVRAGSLPAGGPGACAEPAHPQTHLGKMSPTQGTCLLLVGWASDATHEVKVPCPYSRSRPRPASACGLEGRPLGKGFPAVTRAGGPGPAPTLSTQA